MKANMADREESRGTEAGVLQEGVREIGGPRVALPYIPTGPDTGRGPAAVIGLYSFPKSGNTWLRAIIASILGIPQAPQMMQRYLTDTFYGRPVERPWAFQGRHWYVYKSHHKQVMAEHTGEAFPTDRIVHINRHPLDVFMSYLNFVSSNVSPDAGQSLPVKFDSVEDLSAAELETLFSIFLEHATLFPRNAAFGNVFSHAQAFRERASAKGGVLDLRYEDLSADFEGEVRRLCAFLGFQRVDISRAFVIADQRTRQNGRFFWKRRTETFRSYLTEDQIARFGARHGKAMAALGYAV